TVGGRPASGDEVAAHEHFAAATDGEGIDVAIQTSAQRNEIAAVIPPGEVVRNETTGGGEFATDQEVGLAEGQGVNRSIHPAAQGNPPAAVPARDVVGAASGAAELAADEQVGAAHSECSHALERHVAGSAL